MNADRSTRQILIALLAAILWTTLAHQAWKATDRATAIRRILAEPLPPATHIPEGLGVTAPDRPAAIAILRGFVEQRARIARLPGIAFTPDPTTPDPERMTARLRAAGSQQQVLAFAASIERDPRQIRFQSWSLQGDGVDVTLDGVLRAAWRRP